MVDRAGHWAHEEQAEQVSELLIRFLREARHVPAVRLGTSLSGGDRHLNSAGCRHTHEFHAMCLMAARKSGLETRIPVTP